MTRRKAKAVLSVRATDGRRQPDRRVLQVIVKG